MPPNVVTQGGAIFANAYARNLQITNNVVQNNGGAYGTIRIGTPDLPAPDTNNHNDNVRIANNRVVANAGTNLAGGIGIFAGASGYEVANNDICGNFSAEYGGGVSVYGLSYGFPSTGVLDNFNRSHDGGWAATGPTATLRAPTGSMATTCRCGAPATICGPPARTPGPPSVPTRRRTSPSRRCRRIPR